MNLVLHQFRKDILRTRLVLVLWSLMVVLQFGLACWTVKPGDAVMQTLSTTLYGLLMVFNYLLVLVLVPLLVHQEPLVGTTAFWFTRPISRTTLLASKTLYVSFLVALPILAQGIVFLANGITLHDIALAVPELLISELTWILIVGTLAVLTPSFARFAITGAIILIVWWLGLFMVQMFLLMRNPQGYVSTLASLTSSRDLVGSLIMMGFGLGVVLVQYLTRRFWLAVMLAITSALLSLLAQYVWPWDFLKPTPVVVQDSTFQADSLGAAQLSSIGSNDQGTMRGGTPLKQVTGLTSFANKPRGYILTVDHIDSTLKSKDGRIIPVQSVNQDTVFSSDSVDPDAVELGLGGVPVLNMDNSYQNPQALFTLDADTYGLNASTPLDYSARIDFSAYKYVAVAELPLAKGARYDHGSEHLVITDVLDQTGGVDFLLRQRSVHLLFDPKGPDRNAYMQDRSSVIYVLLNKARHQAVLQKLNTEMNFNVISNGILVNEPLRISFGPDDNNNATNWLAPQLDQAWLADAVLVRLELKCVSTFTRTLAISGFRLDGRFNQTGSPYASRSADLDTLDQITLPHDATRDQVRDYITQILVASRRVTENQHDPQIDMLEKVGAQNVDLLIDMARDNHNYYLNRAVNALAQPDQKAMVIDALATNHDLIDTITDHGWQLDAKPTLLKVFAENNSNNGGNLNSWVIAVASLKDPSTYDALKNYYIDNPNEDVFKALQPLPNFDLAGAVGAAWNKARAGKPWLVRNMLPAAAQVGEPDVLDIAVKMLKSNRDDYARQRARKVLRNFTPATGATDADLIAWYESNKADLVFDQPSGKFVLRSQVLPTAPTAPVVPTPPAKTGP